MIALNIPSWSVLSTSVSRLLFTAVTDFVLLAQDMQKFCYKTKTSSFLTFQPLLLSCSTVTLCSLAPTLCNML